MKTVAVVAPHPDDEVLGVGGTMARLSSEGNAVHVITVTRGRLPLFPDELVKRTRGEQQEAHRILGVTRSHWLDLPAAELDTLAHRQVNEQIGAVLAEITPDEIYLPFVGDIHLDHQLTFVAGLVAIRPHGRQVPRAVYAYETLSETNWNAAYITPGFHPNHFVDVTSYLENKLSAFRAFTTQVRPAPHERSVESVRALATLRGACVGWAAGEAFVTVRTLIPS